MSVPKKWTIMFYFASDNPLAPSVVSQLKALTNAGFHQDVNVVCQFDPHTEGTATHVFDVNVVSKLVERTRNRKNKFKFWGENDPYIRNLVFDKLWNDEDEILGGVRIRNKIADVLRDSYGVSGYNPPRPGTMRIENHRGKGGDNAPKTDDDNREPGPRESLEAFLSFCAKSYPAEHYMLFVLGHGLVVGNDMFLFDENAKESTLSLKNLAGVLEKFTATTNGKKLDLLGFHSCSMSAIEVAFELRDAATFLLASQGPAFVGSWPYREILIRVFNDVILNDGWKPSKRSKRRVMPPTVQSTIERIFEYVLRNSYDFQLAGYSFDLSLCDLRQIGQITIPLTKLANSLKEAITRKSVRLVKEAILLAHWDAQSFWQESYTDLYDFCWCLKRRCEQLRRSSPKAASDLTRIAANCRLVIAVLEKDIRRLSAAERSKAKRKRLIVSSAFAGPQYQYSHGLSIYFPWSEPTNDVFWNKDSGEYNTKYEFRETAWAEFLQEYFDATQRLPIWKEVEDEFGKAAVRKPRLQDQILEEITAKVFNPNGPLGSLAGPGGGKGGPGGALGPGDEKGGPGSGLSKPGGGSGTGGDCDCPAIKNYPTFTFDRPERKYADPNKKPKSTSEDFFQFVLPD